jgi:hypothetical protein
MTTITLVVGDSPEPRQPYSPYLLAHNVMHALTAGGCKQIPLTAENSREAVRAASDFLHAVGVTPGREEP